MRGIKRERMKLGKLVATRNLINGILRVMYYVSNLNCYWD